MSDTKDRYWKVQKLNSTAEHYRHELMKSMFKIPMGCVKCDYCGLIYNATKVDVFQRDPSTSLPKSDTKNIYCENCIDHAHFS